jgi:DNA topoisomerase-3
MSRRVYVCEKPDQARIVAEALGGGRRVDGAYEGSGWAVCWAFGHLLEPAPPDAYDPALKAWDLAALPIVPEVFRFEPRDGKAAQQLKAIARTMRGAGEVVVATDADREGEMIGREILDRLGWKGPVLRLWLSDLTMPAVKRALAHLRPGSETVPLYHAALARTKADWLVGMNMSRAATLRFRQGPGKPLSVGRVQTPTLALIVRLERRIRDFRPEDFFEIVAEVESEGHRFRMRHAPPAEKRIRDAQAAEALARGLVGASGPLRVVQEERSLAPPPLFDLNGLQQEANGRFGWSADKTLKVAQRLYEERQLLTYPRTDCQVLPEDHRGHLAELLDVILSVPGLAPLAGRLAQPLIRPSVYNDRKVTAHHAIVPTAKRPDMGALDPDERLLWDLVARQFLAAHMPDHRFRATGIDLDARGTALRARGSVPVFAGWKEAFQGVPEADPKEDRDPSKGGAEDAEEESRDPLPPVRDGAPARVLSASAERKTTKPPPRFTEKSLLRAMKNIAAYVEDEAARRRLRQTSGIGTPATRAGIIETLKERGYVEVRRRQIVPTDVAMMLIEALEKVAPGYCDPALTAAWEDVLEDVAAGRRPMEQFVQATVERIRRDVASVKAASGGTVPGVVSASAPASSAGASRGTPARAGGSAGGSGPPPRAAPAAASRGRPGGGAEKGTPLTVRYEDKDRAKALGARWDAERRRWVAPPGADLAPFREAGFLKDG